LETPVTNAYADELLLRSAELIEGSDVATKASALNPLDFRASDFGDGLALVTSFSHVIALEVDNGLTLFDTSAPALAEAVRGGLREWSRSPVSTIVYTHGHLDHVGGAPFFSEESATLGAAKPQIVGHEAIVKRFRRYDTTERYNAIINARQFRPRGRPSERQLPRWTIDWSWPDVSFSDRLMIERGGETIVLRHSLGETDDHAWAWLPKRKTICAGDFFIWAFPNAGNPQKVQRYPAEWANALREMAALGPELFLPAHGLPIAGSDRIERVLSDTARALESLVGQTLELMNAGGSLNDAIHTVRVPRDLSEKPYLRATYDEPEFVVRNIWRLYGGWWGGDPSQLKPARSSELAAEVAQLCGGTDRLAERADGLSQMGNDRLACHLVELATQAEPTDSHVHSIRAAVYGRRRDKEISRMARGIFGEAAHESATLAGSEFSGDS
jgi:alkyl sulfatase BDS1-like metallo-beta-lactamase superfamily hydrolase